MDALTETKEITCPKPNEIHIFCNNKVYIYLIFITDYIKYLQYLLKILSEEELERANKFHFEKDRRLYITAHGLQRIILTSFININPKDIIFFKNKYGKPYIKQEQNSRPIRFSLSHSGEMILSGVTFGNEIGVDIEEVKPIKDLSLIINKFATGEEKESFNKVPEAVKLEAFYRWWTQKEALLKFHGLGLSKMKRFQKPDDPKNYFYHSNKIELGKNIYQYAVLTSRRCNSVSRNAT
jgi:4'-phosphopantetheinyl transferase